MTTPGRDVPDEQQEGAETVPPASPAYSSPPPEGMPDADDD